MKEIDRRRSRNAVVTDVHVGEAAQLRRIWNDKQPTLQAQGLGAMARFGPAFGIGNHSSVSLFLAARLPLSMKAADGFAKGLQCKVADFSPRLADKALEDAGISKKAIRAQLARNVALLERLPRQRRRVVAQKLSVLAREPHDAAAFEELVTLLQPPEAR